MSQSIFDLDKYEKRILKFLALKGPMNLSELSIHPSKYNVGKKRWGLRNYLNGAPTHIGLIPYEYVSITSRNKKEKEYSLTTKGILASIADVPLESNIIYQNYVTSVTNYLPTKGSEIFVKKLITESIELPLIWHYIHRINLTNQKYSANYYMKFFDDIRKTSKIKINYFEKTEEEEKFFNIMKNNITNFSTIDLLTSGKLFKSKSLFSVVDWKKTKLWKKDTTDEYLFGQFLWQWPYFLGNNTITLKSKQEESALYKYYSPEITQEVKKNLAQIEAKIRWKSELDSSAKKFS